MTRLNTLLLAAGILAYLAWNMFTNTHPGTILYRCEQHCESEYSNDPLGQINCKDACTKIIADFCKRNPTRCQP